MLRYVPSTRRSLAIALLRAREEVTAPVRDMLLAENITEQQWRILQVLSEFGTLTASDISRKAAVQVSSFTRISGGMLRNGLVRKIRSTEDRRSHSFENTSKGQAIINRNRAGAAEIADRCKAKIGRAKYEMLLDLLTELAEPK